MPKLILATAAALLLGRSTTSARAATDGHATAVQGAMRARTRSRDATRRLRALGSHEPHLDIGPLDLARRH
jgi:hypothetical protein